MRRTRRRYSDDGYGYSSPRRRKTSRGGSFSMYLLCALAGFIIGSKYPESYSTVTSLIKNTAGKYGYHVPQTTDKYKKFFKNEGNDKNKQEIIKGFIEKKKDEIVYNSSQPIKIDANTFQVRFSPHGGCLDFAKGAIDSAKSYILVQGYSFTSDLIANALINAHRRGVNVMILLDKSQPAAVGSQIYNVQNNGIYVAIDKQPKIAHNKIMIIDDKIVLTGSFNWTASAENNNAENLLMINNSEIAKLYKDNWKKRSNKSVKFLETSKEEYVRKYCKKGLLSGKKVDYTLIE